MTNLLCALFVIAGAFWLLWGDDPDHLHPTDDAHGSSPHRQARRRPDVPLSHVEADMSGGPATGEWSGRFDFTGSMFPGWKS